MNRPWSYWLPEVLPHARGCPSAVAIGEIRMAARAFFEGSRVWEVETALVPVAADQAEVTLELDASLAPVRVREVRLDDRELHQLMADQVEDWFGAQWRTASGAPSAFVALSAASVRLYPIPAVPAVDGARARMAVMPAEASEGLPDDLGGRWRDAITAGARARVLAYPNAPWSNMDLAGVYGTAFQTLIDRAVVHVNVRGHGAARRPSRLHLF